MEHTTVGYKQTAHGCIPNEWDITKLSDIGSTYTGLAGKTKDHFGHGESYIPYKTVFDNQFIRKDRLDRVEILPEESQNKVKKGDVIFTTSSETPDEVGMSSVLLEDLGELYLNSFCFGFRPRHGVLDPLFSGYWFRSDTARKSICFLAQGSTRFNISKNKVLNIELPLPPLPEQKKIASILSAVDNKLDLIDRKITTTRTLKKGLMQRLFSQGVGIRDADGHWQPHTEFKDSELGRIPAGWSITPLYELATVRTGVAKGKKNRVDPVKLPYLRVANVKDGYLDLNEIKEIEIERSQIDRYLLQAGDVLMTEGGDLDKLGRGDIWSGQIAPCLHQNHVFAVRCDTHKLLPNYLSSFSGSELGKKYFLGCAKQTTNLASINSSQLKAFPVLLPPMEEQHKIMAVLTSMNQKINHLLQKKNETQQLKKGLMQKLLTGQWRVKV